jgi:hypothetical protein
MSFFRNEEASLTAADRLALGFGFTYIYNQMHHVVGADLKNKINSHPDSFAPIMKSPQWLFSMSGFSNGKDKIESIDELANLVDESLWAVWKGSDVIAESKRFYDVCHCLYSALGDNAGLLLLRKIQPMWDLENVICHYEGVTHLFGRSNAMPPHMVASEWVKRPTAQQGTAMVASIFHSLATMPIKVIYRAFERLAVETDETSRVAVLAVLFNHPIMNAFWAEAFLRNGSVPYLGVRSMSNSADIYDAYLESLYRRFGIRSTAPRVPTRRMGPRDPMDY